MNKSTGYSTHSQALGAILALVLVAACASEAAPPQAAVSTAAPPLDAPQLAGAWYQVYFDTNSVEINARGQMIVKNVAHVVATSAPTRVTVIGKTDRVGASPANMALSQRRADVVRAALVTAGVSGARIDTSWTGEGKQEVATADAAAEQRNRVVDIIVVQEAR